MFFKQKIKRFNFDKAPQSGAGFTLIELLVVIAIIGLLSAVAMVAVQSARQKARNVKRLGDMNRLATALELYFTSNKYYPSSPNSLIPDSLASLPSDPDPADGDCSWLIYPLGGSMAESYYYYPSSPFVIPGNSTASAVAYRDYIYFFCLGHQTGDYSPGIHRLTPNGVK